MARFHVGTQPHVGVADPARVILRLGPVDPTDTGGLAGRVLGVQELIEGARADLARATIMDGDTVLGALPMKPGAQVTADADRSVERMFSCHVPPLPRWLPLDAGHLLHPLRGATVIVEAGVRDPRTGRSWWWPMGRFVLTEPVMSFGADGPELSLTCPDVSWRLDRLTTTTPVDIPAGTSVELGIGLALSKIAPAQPVELAATGEAMPAMRLGGPGDRGVWSSLRDAAAAAGHRLAIDPDGVVRLRPIPLDPALAPAVTTWSTAAGLVLDVEHAVRGSDRIDAIRMTHAYGESIWPEGVTSGRIVDYDGDPTLILSTAQARRALAAQWTRRGGIADTVSGTVWADPRRRVHDIVTLDAPTVGATGKRRIESLSFTIGEPRMSVSLSDVQVGT